MHSNQSHDCLCRFVQMEDRFQNTPQQWTKTRKPKWDVFKFQVKTKTLEQHLSRITSGRKTRSFGPNSRGLRSVLMVGMEEALERLLCVPLNTTLGSRVFPSMQIAEMVQDHQLSPVPILISFTKLFTHVRQRSTNEP